MIEIRYVQSEDKEFWYSLDKHLPEQEYDDGAWKESVKYISNKSCAIISIRMDFQEYYNADSTEKILLTKKMNLKAVRKIRPKNKFDYDAFERDFDAVSMI